MVKGIREASLSEIQKGGEMRTKIIAMVIIISGIVLLLATTSFTLTTDELLQLKKAGISEDIILFILEADYKDVDRVLKLKEAGFKDETILSIIKKDLKGKPSAEILREKTAKDISAQSGEAGVTSKVKILWYMAYSAGPVLQSSQAIDNARISVEGPGSLKFEWKDRGLVDIFLKNPFKSPFYWDINKDDTLGSGREGYSHMLQSAVNHKGKPETDGSHFWVIYFDAKDTKIADSIKENLSNK
jgi:hypothetical protein